MDLGNVALIIVDMQNDFLHKDGFVRKYSQGIGVPASSLDQLRAPIPYIKTLADFFQYNRKEVIYIYTAWEKDYSDVAIPLRKMADKAKETGALVRGSWGAQIIEELTPHETDHMVMKKAYGAFFQSSLDRVLRNLGIKTLVMTGIATNFCVETTSREAVAYGYNVILASDATATYDPEGHQATLKEIAAGFGDVMSTEDVIKLLQQ
ncbi:MAG: cysteine hydrolase [Deltaproteobacteria bacterium]|nr:cysteine hydrolase [Deltaproteobacteria bacterium]